MNLSHFTLSEARIKQSPTKEQLLLLGNSYLKYSMIVSLELTVLCLTTNLIYIFAHYCLWRQRMKDNKSFNMTLNQNTLNFLERWYQLPIQEILRVLATVDKAAKETQKIVL